MELSQEEIRQLVRYLQQFVSDRRWQRMRKVRQYRTRQLTVVLEDIYQPHNASAVLRSCDCFGVQDLHVIENINGFEPNPDVELGASKWLTIHRYRDEPGDNTSCCLESLKRQGYRIAATSVSPSAVSLPEVRVDEPMAVCFGNEEEGLSQTVDEYADMHITIPMYGFTQSFNISVSAAVCMYELSERLRTERDDWGLGEEEGLRVELQWLKNSVRDGTRIAEHFLKHYARDVSG